MKLIKTISILFMSLNSIAQNKQSGVYLTYSDYNNNKLTYSINCKTEKHIIRLNEFLNQSFITVKHKEQKIKLQKDSIYGILNCDEPLVRFQNKEHFYLAEKEAIWIFYKEENVPEGKGFKVQKHYYFSKTGDGVLSELTISNIKYAFPNNHKLHDELDAQFGNGSAISDYDSFHKMFKINHLIKVNEK
jgi:hypothetical protein